MITLLLAVAALPAVAAPPSADDLYVRVVGDLDGDGARDVAVVRPAYPGERTPQVEARSGRTGAALWTLPVTDQHADVFAARLGSPPVPAVVVATYFGAAAVQAIDGHGQTLWRRVWPNRVVVPPEFSPLVGDVVPGGGDDVVVPLDTYAGFETSTVRAAEIVNGSTGITAGVVGPVPTAARESGPVLAGDLDGDGTGDVAWLLSTTAVGAGVVKAYRGDGALLWTSAEVYTSLRALQPAGDLTGDGHGDLVAATNDDPNQAALISGRDGSLRWKRPGHVIDGARPHPYVVTEEFLYDGGRSERDRLRGYDGAGHLRWSTVIPFTWIFAATDLTGDGVPDFTASWQGLGIAYTGPRFGLVDGATGHVLRSSRNAEGYQLDGAFDCHGNDSLEADEYTHYFSIEIRDGRSGRSLWGRRFARSTFGNMFGGLVALPRAGTSCADGVLPVVFGSTYGLTLLDGRTGRPRWSVKL